MLNLIQTGQDQPCVYRIATAGGRLNVEMSPAAFEFLKERLTTETAKSSAELTDELPDFIPPTSNSWGFGPVLQTFRGHHNGWVQTVCRLPLVCDKGNWDWKAGAAAASSLRNLLHPLAFQDGLGDRSFRQGIVVQGLYSWPQSCSIGAYLSPWLLKKLFGRYGQYQEGIRKAVSDAVRQAFLHMHGYRELERYELEQFRVSLEPDGEYGYLMIDCPGDRTGLHTPSGSIFRLECHNVDNPVQQLSLLSGLARLDEIARDPRLDR